MDIEGKTPIIIDDDELEEVSYDGEEEEDSETKEEEISEEVDHFDENHSAIIEDTIIADKITEDQEETAPITEGIPLENLKAKEEPTETAPIEEEKEEQEENPELEKTVMAPIVQEQEQSKESPYEFDENGVIIADNTASKEEEKQQEDPVQEEKPEQVQEEKKESPYIFDANGVIVADNTALQEEKQEVSAQPVEEEKKKEEQKEEPTQETTEQELPKEETEQAEEEQEKVKPKKTRGVFSTILNTLAFLYLLFVIFETVVAFVNFSMIQQQKEPTFLVHKTIERAKDESNQDITYTTYSMGLFKIVRKDDPKNYEIRLLPFFLDM